MSLIKQLWVVIAVVLVLAFVSSFSISSYSARNYFSEQLNIKNIDNANMLALSISQLEKDPTLIELLVAAQFDTGHYQKIALILANGDTFLVKEYEAVVADSVPDWFSTLVPLNVLPGVAQIQDGWQQFGTLYVESHSRFAQQALWQSTSQMFFWFAVVALFSGAIGSLILKVITRPLDDVVAQAEAIGGRRFITSQEPRTLEFGRVVRAMNLLSLRVRNMLETENKRLDEMRIKFQLDELTGLNNRTTFMAALDAALASDDKTEPHMICMLRVFDLRVINQKLGHKATDKLLCDVATLLQQQGKRFEAQVGSVTLARINSSDFAILLTQADDIKEIHNSIQQSLLQLQQAHAAKVNIYFPLAATVFLSSEAKPDILIRLDNVLANAELTEEAGIELAYVPEQGQMFRSAAEWREALSTAINNNHITLKQYPVCYFDGTLFHSEAMVRVSLAGEQRSAGCFIAWARRLGLLPQLDVAVIRQALTILQGSETLILAVNMTIDTIKDHAIKNTILKLLQTQPELGKRLSLEFNEQAVIAEIEAFRDFVRVAKGLGIILGVQAAGNQFAQLKDIQELGLDYLKVDASLIRQLYTSPQDAKDFIGGFCGLGHSLGLTMIAEGVVDGYDISLLQQVGLDAITGPAVRAG
ncbi:GGDEF domain-containing protein [Alishewanella longhuensis]|uniref:GGDEF domain-containing protein n=1 Tax=Alishewanella longhuensis TaxID=1091037 RepID=A0ABQ3L1E5_9ALTE|nr:LapD/MoxY N-terminal periplasmic domain-containing protein [Alishewanella longhuensis]GHG75846.1 GGDEF domain-containing protein [Alishewanella longhuensis]